MTLGEQRRRIRVIRNVKVDGGIMCSCYVNFLSTLTCLIPEKYHAVTIMAAVEIGAEPPQYATAVGTGR